MTDIKHELSDMLAADGTISGVVSARIRPRVLDKNETLPALKLDLITSEPLHHVNGQLTLSKSRIQIIAYAATDLAATSLANDVRKYFSQAGARRGTWGDLTVRDVLVLSGPYDLPAEEPTDGSSEWRYPSAVDISVTHSHDNL